MGQPCLVDFGGILRGRMSRPSNKHAAGGNLWDKGPLANAYRDVSNAHLVDISRNQIYKGTGAFILS